MTSSTLPTGHMPLPSSPQQALTDRLDVGFALRAAQLGVWELDPVTHLLNWDDQCRALYGLTHDVPISYEQAIRSIHPDDVARVDQAVKRAMDPNAGGPYDETYRTVRANDGLIRWVRFMGQAYFDEAGKVVRFAGIAQDVTPDALARQQREESERRHRSLVEEASVATGLFVGREQVVYVANDKLLSYWGKDRSVLGKPFREAVPELEGQPFFDLIDQVYSSGQAFEAKTAPAQVIIGGKLGTYFFDFSLRPLRDADGQVYGVLNTAVDVTEQVVTQAELAQQSAYLQNALEIADLGTFAVDLASGTSTYSENVRHWVKLPSVNEPLSAVLNRIHPDDQGPVQEVIAAAITSEAHSRHDIVYRILDPDTHAVTYLRSFGKAQYKADKPDSIIGILQNVTPQVQAQQQLEATEAALRGAIELAQLATWSLDIPTGLFTYSPRFLGWLGFTDEPKDLVAAYNPLPDEHRQQVANAIEAAIKPGASGFYENEHPIINRQTGQMRIIHAQAQVRYDTTGQPVELSGTAQDVTEQRQRQQELEEQVAQRTQQLQTTVEDLRRSNDNLQQFAYVASHDLQEPLRKIQAFGDLLKNSHLDQPGDGANYLDRMQAAAHRMSILIRDLLSFSRLSTHRANALVPLATVVERVLADVDLLVQETGAQIDVGTLPTIWGDASQLGQLFQNLLTNALKFRKPDAKPTVRIEAHTVRATDLPATVRPAREAPAYVRIDVTDNGIGFDERYLDRIFQVFQRLHGKSAFAGTGIGLAICEKVATNHGGAITARSHPGDGSTFSVYLPEDTV